MARKSKAEGQSKRLQDQLIRADNSRAVAQVAPGLLDCTPIKVGISSLTRYTIPIPPQLKARTRNFAVKNKTSGKVSVVNWTPKGTRTHEHSVAEYCAQQHPSLVPFSGRLSITAIFKVNHLRGDIDNYAKALLDGMQGVVFKNDTCVDELILQRVKVPVGRERTEVAVRPYQPDAISFCHHCGAQVELENWLLERMPVPF